MRKWQPDFSDAQKGTWHDPTGCHVVPKMFGEFLIQASFEKWPPDYKLTMQEGISLWLPWQQVFMMSDNIHSLNLLNITFQ